MADKHPYISGTGGIVNTINQFKKSLPKTVNAETLKRLGIASNNESFVINILRFIGVIDDSGARSAAAEAAFSKHDQAEFAEAFGKMLQSAYGDLFALHGAETWTLATNKLVSFFRGADKTSDLVGRRQATTFQTLASFAGHGEIPSVKVGGSSKPANRAAKPSKASEKASKQVAPLAANSGVPAEKAEMATSRESNVGLTVRIEVNLPAAGDQETYDRIFRSIRENLLNAR